MNPEQLVDAAYKGILLRAADDSGRERWAQLVEQSGPEALFSGLIRSPEFRRRYVTNQVHAGGPEIARWMTNWIVHLSMSFVLHEPRLDLVRNVVPAGDKVLDLGGASQRRQGALLEMGYRHAKDITIVDLPLDRRFKTGPQVDSEFEHEGTTVRYAYHSMADLSY